jgi:hypothetical protein
MGIMQDVHQLEKEMFEGVRIAFECLHYKQAKRLALCLTAIRELDNEYNKITKSYYIKEATMKRLDDGLKSLTGITKNVQAKPK